MNQPSNGSAGQRDLRHLAAPLRSLDPGQEALGDFLSYACRVGLHDYVTGHDRAANFNRRLAVAW